MTPTNQKQTIIQNYTLFFADLLSICLSYGLAILTRGILKDVARATQYYMLILFFAVILCAFELEFPIYDPRIYGGIFLRFKI